VVVGILENRGMALGIDLGDIAIVPLRSAQQMYKGGEDELWEILVGTHSQEEHQARDRQHQAHHQRLPRWRRGLYRDRSGRHAETFSRIFDMLR
jgi:hypothetical protein